MWRDFFVPKTSVPEVSFGIAEGQLAKNSPLDCFLNARAVLKEIARQRDMSKKQSFCEPILFGQMKK